MSKNKDKNQKIIEKAKSAVLEIVSDFEKVNNGRIDHLLLTYQKEQTGDPLITIAPMFM